MKDTNSHNGDEDNRYTNERDNSEEKNFILTVAEVASKDVGRRIARIDPKVAEDHQIQTGDALKISSEKTETVALSWPARQDDYGKGLIRIDGYLRNKLDVGINERVQVTRAVTKDAKNITLAPTEPLRILGAEEYLSEILEGQVVTKGDIVPLGIMGQIIHLVVVSTNPTQGALLIKNTTRIAISEEAASAIAKDELVTVTYEDVGGLRNEVGKIREMIELPLRHPELFKRLGIQAPKGVILHGPPGTGKTLLAKAIANETTANFYSLSGPEIMSKFYGESEERLRKMFQQAEQNSPAILFVDELDSIAPKREEVSGEVERRIVSQLLALMDGLSSRGKVVVIGATNRVNAIDPALRRPGRFDREIELGVPDKQGRLEILNIHTRNMPLSKDVDLEKISEVTHGFVGADIQALAKEAAMSAIRRVLPEIDLTQESIPHETLNKISVTMHDFTDVLRDIEPSAMREVFVEIPDVTWNDVGGLYSVKEELLEAVEWPLKFKKLFGRAHIKPPKGIFLYGPPGTGKTLLAKAIANESEANFISIKGPELLSKWVGESEKGIREVFRKARQAAPCIVFFDEIDAIAPVRGGEFGDSHVTERVISQLLTELDGLEELRGVVVIAASNRPDIVDPALIRPGRFDRLLYVPLPDFDSRMQILKIHTQKMPLTDDANVAALSKMTDGYTGADIASFASAAAMIAMKEHIAKYKQEAERESDVLTVNMGHFEQALKKIRPLSPQELNWYQRTAQEFGRNIVSYRRKSEVSEGGVL
ncbi:MAG TPA: CDC48 family AAA ATPase [Nitrososphaeraceae archaeon]|jgi:transitional endoplasmic reticulum ATPase|nr:CDC48 family AAA ATPase [Nitrososphaeraceae archaeon]